MAKEQADQQATTGTTDDDALRCAACEHVISNRAYRSEMAGAHEHTFVNPGGFVYTIGCFVAAPGCVHAGVPDEAFSWFPGWKWQIAECGRCRRHLGWLFRCAGEQFHGLILATIH